MARGGVAVVAVAQVSNVTGARADVRRLAEMAHAAGAVLVVDAAQSVPHLPVDVRQLDCDFLAFSGHKLGAPAGIGGLFGRPELLEELGWHLRGGGTVETVRGGQAKARAVPWRLEAGTPPVEVAAGLSAAVDYLRTVGLEEIEAHEKQLFRQALARLRRLSGARLVGPDDPDRGGPLSFVVDGAPSHLLARTLSDAYGICVRSGFQCAEPLHESLGLAPSVRLSFGPYNQPGEIDAAFDAIERVARPVRR
jgi:cysteine desulfurase/selenocysteine lyase